MIDFMSTRLGIDEQSKRCAHFIAAILAQAVNDLSIPCNASEKRNRRNTCVDALASIRFFYEENSPFKIYASAIGIDPQAFIYNLEHRSFNRNNDLTKPKKPYISDRDARIMRVRIKFYKNQQAINQRLEATL